MKPKFRRREGKIVKKKFVPREARILFFDIEASHLKADWGYILCVSWKFLGEKKVRTLLIDDSPSYRDDPTDDSWVIEGFLKVYEEAEISVAHYGVRFDIKYLNTRLLYHGLPPLPRPSVIDTWKVAKDNLALSSNRLNNIVGFFGLPDKTPVKGDIWRKAIAGHKPSLQYIKKHCEADILALEATYLKLRPLIHNHPNVNLVTGRLSACSVCGSGNIIKRGYTVKQARVYQRYSCLNCGKPLIGQSEVVLEPKEILK